MHECREIHLGREAELYSKECLGQGKTLSKHILQSQELERGVFLTYLPPEVSLEQANELRTGGKLRESCGSKRYATETGVWVPKPTDYSHIVSTILAFLRSGEGRICIFEDAVLRPGDPDLDSLRSQLLTYDDEVYHVLWHKDALPDKIAQTIYAADDWLFVGAMTSFQPGVEFPRSPGTLSLDEIRVCAQRVEGLVLGAYDGEGYLFWRRL